MNKIQKVLLIGGNIFDFGEGMLGPLFAVFAQRVGGDILEISWAASLYLFIVGSLTMILGKISDKWDKRKMMLLGYFLGAVFTFSYLWVSKPLHLFFVQAGLGLASALCLPTWNALYSESCNSDNHGTSWGMASGLSRIISAMAMLAGGFIVGKISFSALFIIMGSIQLFATVYQAKILYLKKE